jgi:hypothetical protein
MPYSPQTWIDGNSSYPLSAARMGIIETGIQTATATAELTGSIFANEAARDAAIPSPVEGARAYLTAPTIPAATGSLTSIPTGIDTRYNGSVWVCLTDVASTSVTSTTGTVTSSFTAPWTVGSGDTITNSVTAVTGTTAWVDVGYVNLGLAITDAFLLGVAVSGATTQAASLEYSVMGSAIGSDFGGASGGILFTGLTAGANTFTLQMAVLGGGGIPMTHRRRFISVRGIA